MSEDLELLKMAAKGAGHEYRFNESTHMGPHFIRCTTGYQEWNPLIDDGDALRLAVKLKIDLRFQQDGDVYVDAGDCDAYTVYLIDANGDLGTATRFSIVRAAAAIGRDMP